MFHRKKIGNILILSVVLAVIFYAFVIIAVGFVMNPGDIIASQEATGLVTADAMAAAFNTKIMARLLLSAECVESLHPGTPSYLVVPVQCIPWQSLT